MMMMPFSQDVESGLVSILEEVSLQVNAVAEKMALANPQVHVVDLYALTAVSVPVPGTANTILKFTPGAD